MTMCWICKKIMDEQDAIETRNGYMIHEACYEGD